MFMWFKQKVHPNLSIQVSFQCKFAQNFNISHPSLRRTYTPNFKKVELFVIDCITFVLLTK